MSNVTQFPKIVKNENSYSSVSTNYKNDYSEFKWEDIDEKVILSYCGYNSNKPINTEYNIKEINKEEVYSHMDNDKLLEKYIDSINKSIRDMEKRNIEDKREREQRIEKEKRISEERMEKRFMETMEVIKNQNISINGKFDKLDSKYEQLKWWILGTAIAIILSVVTIIKG